MKCQDGEREPHVRLAMAHLLRIASIHMPSVPRPTSEISSGIRSMQAQPLCTSDSCLRRKELIVSKHDEGNSAPSKLLKSLTF